MLHQLVGPLAPPHPLQRLIDDRLDAIAIRGQRRAHAVAPEHRARMPRRQGVGAEPDHRIEADHPLIDWAQTGAADRVQRREGLVKYRRQESSTRLSGYPDCDVLSGLTGRVDQVQSNSGNGQLEPLLAERAGRRQISVRRRAPSELQPGAGIDEERIRERGAELVAAIASGAADVGDAVDEQAMRDDLGLPSPANTLAPPVWSGWAWV